MSGNEPMWKTPDESTHFQKLDFAKLEVEKAVAIEQAKADKRVAEIKAQADYHRQIRRKENAAGLRIFGAWACAVIAVLFSVWGGWELWGQHGPKTVDDLKQERFKACVQPRDFDGAPKQVWYPDYANGQGLCLPRDKQPPPGAK